MQIIDMPEFKNRNTILSCDPDETIHSAVTAMAQKNCGSILVIKNNKLRGIFTERDLLLRVVANDYDVKKTKISEVMSKNLETAKTDDKVSDCLGRMSHGRFRHMPILDEKGKVTGMLSQRDFVAYTMSDILNRAKNVAKANIEDGNSTPYSIVAAIAVYTLGLLFLFSGLGY